MGTGLSSADGFSASDRSWRLVHPAELWLWAILAAFAACSLLLKFAVFVCMTGDLSPLAFADRICIWDCRWFGKVAQGYEIGLPTNREGQANWAFFPLYPLAVQTVAQLTTLSWDVAGVLVSQLFGILTAGLARPLFGDDDRAYWLFAFSVLLGPFSLLFSMPYSESLYILLTILVLVQLQRGDYLGAGAWSALLSATRVTGVLIGAAILLQAVIDHRRNGGTWRDLPRSLLSNNRLLLGLALVPVGLVAYMVYLRLLMGDGLAFAHVQVAWGRALDNPFFQFGIALNAGWPFRDHWDPFSTYAVGGAVAVVLTTLVALRGRYAAALFCFLALMLSFSSGLFSSVRFAAGLAPLGVVTAELVARRRWLYWAAYPIGLGLGLVIVAGWLSGRDFTMV